MDKESKKIEIKLIEQIVWIYNKHVPQHCCGVSASKCVHDKIEQSESMENERICILALT